MEAQSIGERIRVLREGKGWSPFDLAIASRIQEQNIRNWESGRKVPSTGLVPIIARALGVTPNVLFGIQEPAATGTEG